MTASAGPIVGAEMDESAWERALKTAMRDSYVVQEVTQGADVASFRSTATDRSR